MTFVSFVVHFPGNRLLEQITQRGVDRRETFFSDEDRQTYLRLLQQNLDDAGASLVGWCLMTNHVHLIALPIREDSAAVWKRQFCQRDGGRKVTSDK